MDPRNLTYLMHSLRIMYRIAQYISFTHNKPFKSTPIYSKFKNPHCISLPSVVWCLLICWNIQCFYFKSRSILASLSRTLNAAILFYLTTMSGNTMGYVAKYFIFVFLMILISKFVSKYVSLNTIEKKMYA